MRFFVLVFFGSVGFDDEMRVRTARCGSPGRYVDRNLPPSLIATNYSDHATEMRKLKSNP